MVMPPPRSADELVRRVLASPEHVEALKRDPERVLRNVASEVIRDSPAFENDVWLYRVVVMIIGLTALVSVIGAVAIGMSQGEQKVPDILTALGSGAIGALAGFLTPMGYRR